ncbi:MAG: class II fructose-1,6-bisphosphate aldolase [Candidatus Eisenbacteria bacterium]|nr:class II fructose-1,6-bisphosphate aldolase [Candidatus Eisenbacteria bacterium]
MSDILRGNNMALTTNREILNEARKRGYAVGAFNFNNMEFLQAIVEAGEEERSPAILAVSEGAVKYAGLPTIVALARSIAGSSKIPFSLHLDHGKDMALIEKCVEHGFTSIMLDGSEHPFDENVSLTKEAVKIAKSKGVSVEGELGRLAGIEDLVSVEERNATLTDPDEARRFVDLTGIDSLAVSVGTSHGAYKFKGEAVLALERIREIKAKVSVPLVLHGASGVMDEFVTKAMSFGATLGKPKGVPDESIKMAIKEGVSKINIDTDLRLAFLAGLRETLSTKPAEFDPRKILAPGKSLVKQVVKFKMRLFGSSGAA